MKPENLFTEAPFNPDKEFLETLAEGTGFKLNRIVSHGHRTPEGQWYNEPKDEWVALLSGKATLLIEDKEIDMTPGSYLFIPAHVEHRVEWTDETCETVWLALYAEPSAQ
ncbi:cupin domain-containing protein [Sansalvadorimonas verongulae]|uniref:cupin domain-containing protein n=1 Tax=Sansalvadorimonas verongulae TaxID=2172824 RepID=UPI0012BB734A|nr:cupin domain-containing protein [Sansalvadorimonas verongulae]MTI12247.1 cupin domain-containing protein [Sansalvadorimonas verongulae]